MGLLDVIIAPLFLQLSPAHPDLGGEQQAPREPVIFIHPARASYLEPPLYLCLLCGVTTWDVAAVRFPRLNALPKFTRSTCTVMAISSSMFAE